MEKISDQPTNIRLVRMIGGDCVISFIDVDEEGFYIFKRPIQIVTDPEFMIQSRKKMLVMYAWLPSSLMQGDSVLIAPENVLYTAPLAESMVESYIEFSKRLYDPEKTQATDVEDVTKQVLENRGDKPVDRENVKDLLQEVIEGLRSDKDKDKMN